MFQNLALAMLDTSTRVHITPFSRDLLSAILPASLRGQTENISYHTLDTFPESNYGYLDLPPMEADKIKKKLNGSILKGKKIRIEEARPKKRTRQNEDDNQDIAVEPKQQPKRSKKPQEDSTMLAGHELSPDRKVKRGWTELKKTKKRKSDKNGKEQETSKYTDKEELLFKTKLPPNKVKSSAAKNAKRPREVTVHEFEKSTTQPSFLRDRSITDSKQAVEFVEDVGWVDKDGNLVEEKRRTRRSKPQGRVTKSRSILQPVESTNEFATSADESASDSQPDDQDDDSTSSSGTSDESDSSPESPAPNKDAPSTTDTAATLDPSNPAAVHPLEAIFKRPTRAASQGVLPSLEVQTSFSFQLDEGETETDPTAIPPDTPLNSQDARSRGHRSAAPTPDTAHPSRFNSWGSSRRSRSLSQQIPDDEDEDEEDETMTPSKVHGLGITEEEGEKPKKAAETEFSKWFWEKRGDNNRAWKKRRRDTAKEKRQRVNRQSSRRF